MSPEITENTEKRVVAEDTSIVESLISKEEASIVGTIPPVDVILINANNFPDTIPSTVDLMTIDVNGRLAILITNNLRGEPH